VSEFGPNADQMVCRACGRQERASEGYPCRGCDTFICVVCNMWGVTRCKECLANLQEESAATGAGS
jgi:hypothetical protein